MQATATHLLTLSDISSDCQVTTGVAGYALKKYGPAPTRTIAGIRVWSADQLPQIRESVARTDRRRQPQPGTDSNG